MVDRRVTPFRRGRLVAFCLIFALCEAGGQEKAVIEVDPPRVVIEGRFTVKVRTTLPWGGAVIIEEPEIDPALRWYSLPYARPWTAEPAGEEPVQMVEVLSSIWVSRPGLYRLDSFRIETDGAWSVSNPQIVIGLAPDEANLPYPVSVVWRDVPETLWQGQAFPLLLEARNLSGLVLPESLTLEEPPPGLLENASSFGSIVTRSFGEHVLYDVPVGSWIWTPTEAGPEVFPGLRVMVADLDRRVPGFRTDVRALPEPAVASGAVGRFRLDSRWPEGLHETGDIVTVHVRVEGEGNLNVLMGPVPEMTGARKMGTTAASSYHPSENGYVGWREDHYGFQLESPGSHQIVIPAWNWLEPVGDGVLHTHLARRSTLVVLEARAEQGEHGNKVSLLGTQALRMRRSDFHWRSPIWFLLLLPGLSGLFFTALLRRSVVRTSAFLVLFSLLLVSSRPPGEIETLLAEAVEVAEAGDVHTALELYTDLNRRYPDVPGLLHDLAVLENGSGHADAAVHHLRRALYLKPGDMRLKETLRSVESNFGLNDQIPALPAWPPELVFTLWLAGANLFFVFLALRFHRRRAREAILIISTAIILVFATVGMIWTEIHWHRNIAVSTASSGSLRKIPEPLAGDWITLPAGTTVEIRAVEGLDYLVRTGFGLEGWLSRESLLFISEDGDGFRIHSQ